MVKVEISPVAPGDIDELAANMRQADRDELVASGADDPAEAVAFSCASSVKCWAARADGRLACIFGVGAISMANGEGAPWLLGTDEITRNRRAFMRHAKAYITEMLSLFPTLVNAVDARNSVALRWLKRTGFEVYPAEPMGPAGMAFHPFKMEAK